MNNHRRGFTLVELLVVIGIVALLLAVLLPTLSRARQAARKTLCANNLRQFVAADTMYLNDHGRFPPVARDEVVVGGTTYTTLYPTYATAVRLNQTAAYLDAEPIEPDAAGDWPDSLELPQWATCPVVDERGVAVDAWVAPGSVSWYLGYGYFGGVGDEPGVFSSVETPTGFNWTQTVDDDRAADARGTRRGVLWADTLGEFRSGSDGHDSAGFSFHHIRGTPTTSDIGAGVFVGTDALDGQHLGWSDGAVLWRSGDTIKVDPDAGRPDGRLMSRYASYTYYY